VRFPVSELRLASRASGGVRGIRLAKNDRVVSMVVISSGDQLFTLSVNGFGKRTPIEEYPKHHRGGAGVVTFKVTDKTGRVAVSRMVREEQELICISHQGIVLRTRMESIRITGRAAQGVTVMNLGAGDAVASVATIDMESQGPAATAEGPAPDAPPRQEHLPEETQEAARPATNGGGKAERGRAKANGAGKKPPAPKASASKPKPAAKKPPAPAPKRPSKPAARKTPARRPTRIRRTRR
jgi:DNA gyrase subunit A